MQTHTRRHVVGFLALVLIAGACGGGGHGDHGDHGGAAAASGVDRTIDVEMRDIAYEPATVSVQVGETVKFVFRNVGEATHDAFLGDEAAQVAHEQEMGTMDGGHSGQGGHAVTVRPGQTGSLTYTFAKAEPLLIGCHQPGHYAAGMKVVLTVA